jgi:tetratricopeptide (TPR) repeat protein
MADARAASGAAAASSPAMLAVDAVRAGEVAYNTGDLTSALRQYETAAEADPDNPIALNNVGQMLVRLDRAADAVPYFDRAIARSPEAWAYHFNRARAYAQMEDWARAIAGYRDAARLFPDDYATQFNLARAQQANGDLAGAIDSYARAIELAPGQAGFHLSHAAALEMARRPREAAAAYRRYLELEPASAQAEKIRERIVQLEGVESGS